MTSQKQDDNRKYLDGNFTKVKALDNGIFEGIVATNGIDRHGEVINIMGIDTTNYMSTNPIVLFGHDYWAAESVIGKALTLSKTKGGQLLSKFELFVDDNPKALLVSKLIKKGVLSLSIGFVPTEISGNEYVASEMVEYSVVPVPANGQAAITARSLSGMGLTKKEIGMVKEVVGDVIDDEEAEVVTEAVEVVEAKGAVQDELDAEAMWEQKCAMMEDVREIYWAFCDVYYNEDTPVDQFNTLLTEVISLFQQVVAGTYVDSDDDSEENMDDANEVVEYSVSQSLKNVNKENIRDFVTEFLKAKTEKSDANITTKGIADDGDVTQLQNFIQDFTNYVNETKVTHSALQEKLQAAAGGNADAKEAEEQQSGTDHDMQATNTVKEITVEEVVKEEAVEEAADTTVEEKLAELKAIDLSSMKTDNILQLAKMLKDFAVAVEKSAEQATNNQATQADTHAIVRKRRVVLRETKTIARKADKVVELLLTELKKY